MATSERIDTIVCLGAWCGARRRTSTSSRSGWWREIGRLSVVHRMPMALGVLTTETIEQALERSGGTHGNKGYDAALAAIEMANLARQFA